MSDINTINLKCACCNTEYNSTDIHCASCGFPFQGTEQERHQYLVQYISNRNDKEEAQSKIKSSKIVLYLLAAFTIVWSIISFFNDADIKLIIMNLLLAFLYAGLGYWSNTKPFAAIFTGGLIYLGIIILNAVFEPLTIIQGIIFKVFFIAAFTKAAYGAYKFKISKIEDK